MNSIFELEYENECVKLVFRESFLSPNQGIIAIIISDNTACEHISTHHGIESNIIIYNPCNPVRIDDFVLYHQLNELMHEPQTIWDIIQTTQNKINDHALSIMYNISSVLIYCITQKQIII